jgi:hypothetical protein
VGEREAEWTVVLGRSQRLIAAENHKGGDSRCTLEWKDVRVIVPSKEDRLEENGQDAEKRSRPTGSPPGPPNPNTR